MPYPCCCPKDCPDDCYTCSSYIAESADSGCPNCDEEDMIATGPSDSGAQCVWTIEGHYPGGVIASITCVDVDGKGYWRVTMSCPYIPPTNTFTADFPVRSSCPPLGVYLLDSGDGGGPCLGTANLILTAP